MNQYNQQTSNYHAMLIFCEGPHDTSFVKVILEKVLNFSTVRRRLSELPSPLDKLLTTTIQKHAAGEDLSLDMAHRFFLPDHIMHKTDIACIALVFNTGGKDHSTANIKEFLGNFLILFNRIEEIQLDHENNGGTLINSTSYLFVQDADDDTTDKIFKRIANNFSEINNAPWMPRNWNPDANNSAAAKFDDDKGVYIWCGTNGKGTLEDILLPIFQHDQAELMRRADTAVETTHNWPINASANTDEKARRSKSIITLAGQRKKPGASMNAIVAQANLFTTNTLETSAPVQNFVKFITQFMSPPQKLDFLISEQDATI